MTELNDFPANSAVKLQEAVDHFLHQRASFMKKSPSLDWVISDPVLHFLTPVLYFLDKEELLALPKDLREQAAAAYFLNKARWSIGEARLRQIVGELHQAGIEVIPLKGAILQSLLYRDNGLRAMNDIDILVRPADFLRAAELLLETGLQLSPHTKWPVEALSDFPASELPGELTFYDGHGFGFDLHRSLMPTNWFSGIYRVDMDEVWSRSLLLSEAQQASVLTGLGLWKRLLSPYDIFAHLCLHLGLHGLQNTKSYLDLDVWVRNLPDSWDWQVFLETVNRWQIRSSVYHSLIFCIQLLGTPVPQSVLEQLDPGWLARWRVQALISARVLLSNRPSLGFRYPTLVKLALSDSLVQIFNALWRVIFPNKSMLLTHPSQGGLFGHWLHILDVIRRGD